MRLDHEAIDVFVLGTLDTVESRNTAGEVPRRTLDGHDAKCRVLADDVTTREFIWMGEKHRDLVGIAELLVRLEGAHRQRHGMGKTAQLYEVMLMEQTRRSGRAVGRIGHVCSLRDDWPTHRRPAQGTKLDVVKGQLEADEARHDA
nr:hypothetical protein [Dyella monticola]